MIRPTYVLPQGNFIDRLSEGYLAVGYWLYAEIT